jgi:hypothetical protein
MVSLDRVVGAVSLENHWFKLRLVSWNSHRVEQHPYAEKYQPDSIFVYLASTYVWITALQLQVMPLWLYANS